jgi:hypothetical protein
MTEQIDKKSPFARGNTSAASEQETIDLLPKYNSRKSGSGL